VAHVYSPSYSGGVGRRTIVQGWSRQKHETLPEKQTKAKRGGGVAQVAVHLPSKCRALSSNPTL
jgi:hypothetical protein